MSRDEILSAITPVRRDLVNLRARKKSLKVQIDRLRKSLRKLSGHEFEYTRLAKSVESNRSLLTFLAEKLFALQMRAQGQGTVVKIIDPPNFPSSPVQALGLKDIAFLMVFALGTAGGLGFLIEYLNEPVESEKAIRQQVGLPFLGSALAVPSP